MLTIDPQSLSQVLVNAVNARNGAPGANQKALASTGRGSIQDRPSSIQS